ncbi:MAG: hypothetical protein LBO77_07320 [Desulfovibrio sp.]|jgi:hypothetical protein|nr:hypothetical protein [Desulfovibrio sp.]
MPDLPDAEAGGPALCDSPFRLGRMHMLDREESIYLASRRQNGPDYAAEDRRIVRNAEAEAAALLVRQEEECSLFQDLLTAAVCCSPSGLAPFLRSPGELDHYLARYIACALQGRPEPDPCGPDGPAEEPPSGYYWPADAGGRLIAGQEADQIRIHPQPLEEEPVEHLRLRRPGKKDRRLQDDGMGKKQGASAGKKKIPPLSSRYLRLFLWGGSLAAAYLILTGKGCSLPR